jgi:hypothetical protein
MQLANGIEDNHYKSNALSKVISEKLNIKDRISGEILQTIVTHIVTYSSSRIITYELWNYMMKQCIGYPEIAYIVCSFIAERYPKSSIEIAGLISKYNF